jgi:hypothetical protein
VAAIAAIAFSFSSMLPSPLPVSERTSDPV